MSKRKPIARKVAKMWPKKALAEKTYAAFVSPFLFTIKRMAMRMCGGNKTIADDLVAEAKIKIITGAGTWDKKRDIRPFVLAIAQNAMLDGMRREVRHRQHFKQEPFDELLLLIDSNVEEPMRQLSVAKRSDIVKGAKWFLSMANVNPQQKEMFIYYTGLKDGRVKSQKETAKYFNTPVGTVKSGIWAVRKELNRLKRLLAPQK